jgi:hypothetical protein
LRASIGARDDDAAYVADLLRDRILLTTRVRSWRETRPFGSTVARETFAEVELPAAVTIDAEDVEMLPRRVRLELAKGGGRFRATARLRTDDGSQVVYALEES